MRILVLLLVILTSTAYANIGEVTKQIGEADIIRKDGDGFRSNEGFGIESYDVVKTKVGRTSIEFVDDTRVDVTENSKLVIDEFVYDPNTSTGSLALKASFGTVRYASGQIAKNSKQNVKITTPTAVIGVRGTDFTMTVDETGNSTIILLPSCTIVMGSKICVVGEIEVSSDVGTVILNQAFQATVVETPKSRPLNPITLDIDESLINNLLVVRKPVEIEEELERERIRKLSDFLGFDFLEFDELNKDYLSVQTEGLWMTDLDIDFLGQDFLRNVLDLINEALARLMRGALDERTQGIQLGKDPETGIELYDQKPDWLIRRDDGMGNFFELRLNQQHGYNINMQQGDFEYRDYQLGDGQNEIDIIQVQ
tara:strand:+ start:3101 stop:4204 length:1104 start_codon:yes stop_codon:yes gene_type:complete